MVLLVRGLGEPTAAKTAVPLETGWEFRRWRDGGVLLAQPLDEVERLYGTTPTSLTGPTCSTRSAGGSRRAVRLGSARG